MTRYIDIFGSFIDSEIEREDENDITPNIFKESISDLVKGDVLKIHINSCGGNCTSGIAIANMIRSLKTNGIKTVCIVDGICASIATLAAMACDELKMYPQSFIMIHNPYTFVQGDAEKLRKEAISLDAMKAAILSFYHEKFALTDEELTKYMDEETWISGLDKDTYKLNAAIIEGEREYKMAAKMIEKMGKFFNTKTVIERFFNMQTTETETKEVIEETPETKETAEVTEEVKEEIVEKTETEEKTEEVIKPTYKELEKRIEELTKQLDECTKKLAEYDEEEEEEEEEDSVEKRVSGMQSTMQNKINALTKQFTDEIENANKELHAAKEECTSLKDRLEKASKEFSDMKSAYDEKTNALARLNASVLKSNETSQINWRNLKGKDFINWVESNHEAIKANNI